VKPRVTSAACPAWEPCSPGITSESAREVRESHRDFVGLEVPPDHGGMAGREFKLRAATLGSLGIARRSTTAPERGAGDRYDLMPTENPSISGST